MLNEDPNLEDHDHTATSGTFSTNEGFYQERESQADKRVEAGTSPALRTAVLTGYTNTADTSDSTMGNLTTNEAVIVQ